MPCSLSQAYRDWGVELFDWQSQSSMLADEGGLTATDRRMMPTVGACSLALPAADEEEVQAVAWVNRCRSMLCHAPQYLQYLLDLAYPAGCEADAIAYTQDARQLFSTGPAGPPPTVAADGSYSTGAFDVSAADCHKAAFEACLMLPCQPGGQQHRLRLVHNLARLGAERRWQLQDVELHWERFGAAALCCLAWPVFSVLQSGQCTMERQQVAADVAGFAGVCLLLIAPGIVQLQHLPHSSWLRHPLVRHHLPAATTRPTAASWSCRGAAAA